MNSAMTITDPQPVTIVTADDTRFEITDTGLVTHGNPTFDQWYTFGKQLSRKYSNIQFCAGDWINEGETRFGEKYSQALSDDIFSYGTLRNYASIASGIPKTVRRPELKFHQQKYVAQLRDTPDLQKRILDFAADKRLSGDDIHELVCKTLGKPLPGSKVTSNESDIDSQLPASIILDTSATITQAYTQDDGDYIIVRIGRGENGRVGAGANVRVTISELPEG